MGSERQRRAIHEELHGGLAILVSIVLARFLDSPPAVQWAYDAVLRRKGIQAEALGVQRDAALSLRYPALAGALAELAALRHRIAASTMAQARFAETASQDRELAQWKAQRYCMEADLARQIPELELEQRLRSADRRAISGHLPRGVALIEFVRLPIYDFSAVAVPLSEEQWKPAARWKPPHYLAFVMPSGQPDGVQLVDLGEADPIDRLIADFRASVTGESSERADGRGLGAVASPRSPEPVPGSGERLRQAIFDPIAARAPGIRRLLIAPDGDVSRLPFEVLPQTNVRRLIDDYEISYLSVGRDALRFGAPPAAGLSAPLVMADPDFDLPANPPTPRAGAGDRQAAVADHRSSRDLRRDLKFERLPGTQQEGGSVGSMLGVEPVVGGEALKGRLKRLVSPAVLHLATHGFFLPDLPREDEPLAHEEPGSTNSFSRPWENPLLRSGLALAGANVWLAGGLLPEDAEDGLLTAEDVTGLDLLGTQLVVLSACETGLGEIRSGEGVFGLRRAVMLAGAQTLILSLWKIPDRQTQELMEEFYRRVLQGRSRAQSLREAQLAIKARYPDPYYWGALVCQGDPMPLPRQEPCR